MSSRHKSPFDMAQAPAAIPDKSSQTKITLSSSADLSRGIVSVGDVDNPGKLKKVFGLVPQEIKKLTLRDRLTGALGYVWRTNAYPHAQPENRVAFGGFRDKLNYMREREEGGAFSLTSLAIKMNKGTRPGTLTVRSINIQSIAYDLNAGEVLAVIEVFPTPQPIDPQSPDPTSG